jgi:hypothetical protein
VFSTDIRKFYDGIKEEKKSCYFYFQCNKREVEGACDWKQTSKPKEEKTNAIPLKTSKLAGTLCIPTDLYEICF